MGVGSPAGQGQMRASRIWRLVGWVWLLILLELLPCGANTRKACLVACWLGKRMGKSGMLGG